MIRQHKIMIAAILAILPGILSIREGGSVLLGLTTKGYPVLPWLVWYNVVMGFGSVATGIGIWRGRSWGERYAATILALHGLVLLILVVLFAFKAGVAVASIMAMLFRTAIWSGIVVLIRAKKQ